MYYPRLNYIPKSKEIMTYFGGYDHRITCQEGYFFDEKNISTDDFPILAVRKPRNTEYEAVGKVLGTLSTPEADMAVFKVSNTATYSRLQIDSNGPRNLPSHELNLEEKTIVKMGKYIVVFPDKKWFIPGETGAEGECGDIEATKEIASGTQVKFQLVDSDGSNITINTAATDGNYRIVKVNGKSALQVFSSATNMWVNVATVYFKIQSTGIGVDFKKGDGVKITCDFTNATVKNYKNIWVNEDEDNPHIRYSNFVIKDRGDDYITIVGILGEASKTVTNIPVTVERKCPDIAYVCECQNRLWGCSKDGHEIYACKLGDVTNWNCFDGVATDSWAATVGSDGEFTGAFAYLGYPIFFKEDKILKVSISGYGAHSYKEMESRGVQKGSSKSLVMINELLYYKSKNNVCVYDGNFPQEIGDELGNEKYEDAVGCAYKDKYYLSLEHDSNPESLFVYDTKNQAWAREDNVRVNYFTTWRNLTAYCSTGIAAHPVRRLNLLDYSGIGEPEGKVDWMAESGNIGFNLDEKKYISRMNFRMKLEVGTYVQLFIEYDSSGNWEHVWNVTGKGTKMFSIPVRPKRCDHFRFKLVGKGDAKIFSYSKTYEEGSDL